MSGKTLIYIAKVVSLLLVFGMYSCKPEDLGYSDIPEIRLESLRVIKSQTGKDSLILLDIFYQDGDGDIGLTATDTAAPFNYGSPYYHNLPVTYLVSDTSGVYSELINPTNDRAYGNQHERVPNLTPAGKYKAISGVIHLSLTANPALVKPKKVKFEFKLIDRALNISNTITTESIELVH